MDWLVIFPFEVTANWACSKAAEVIFILVQVLATEWLLPFQLNASESGGLVLNKISAPVRKPTNVLVGGQAFWAWHVIDVLGTTTFVPSAAAFVVARHCALIKFNMFHFDRFERSFSGWLVLLGHIHGRAESVWYSCPILWISWSFLIPSWF